jgi:hypothetical protein
VPHNFAHTQAIQRVKETTSLQPPPWLALLHLPLLPDAAALHINCWLANYWRTSFRALSSFSIGMLVQVRCIMVSTQICVTPAAGGSWRRFGCTHVSRYTTSHHVLHLAGYVEGHVRCAASCSPGDVTECRTIGRHAVLALKQILNALVCARRKELKAEECLAIRYALVDLVYNLHCDSVAAMVARKI